MTVECRGTGDPTLLFLVGTGAARTQMRAIEDEFVSVATVCDYDRADRPDDSVTDRGAALEGLLEAAGIRPPYVLVGQSVGGDLAWHFATTHPDRVRAFIAMNPGPFWLDPEVMAKVWTPEEIAAELPPPGSEREQEALALQSASPPEAMPYVIMLSTVAQCDSPTDICGRFYPAYEAWGQELASRSPRGRFVSVEAGHEIFAEDPEAVVREIRGVLGG